MTPRSYRATLASSVALVALMASSVRAGPNGGTVVGGSATISGAGTGTVVVNQSTANAIINWQTFNLATGESATFKQPGASSVVLNRVIGGLGPSFINGTLNANGQVFIVNGDGILIGRNASINAAGFLATTSDIRNEDFLAGRMNFTIPGRPDASIVNRGQITAASGGFAALVAPGVRNSGTITATLGTVSLAAGNGFTLDFYGDKLITLAVTDQIASTVIDVASGKPLKSLVENKGTLSANGGRVELTAAAARAVVNSVINNKGVIEADSIGTRDGMIVLGAANGTVKLSGKISATGKDPGTTGGTVVVTGENIALKNAQIDASGDAGGGKVLIGGDTGGGKVNPAAAGIAQAALEAFPIPSATTLSMDAKSVINVSATGNGNGGKAVLWSDQQTTFAGSILAQGGATGGDGGFVETSSHGQLAFTGTVDTRAPAGRLGTLLLDPGNVTIQSGGTDTVTGSGGTFSGSNSQTNSILTVNTLQNTLASNNVLVQTGTGGVCGDFCGDININASFSWNSGSTLTLSAFRNISFNESVLVSATGGGSLILRSDSTGTGTGRVNFTNSNQVSVNTGTVSIYYNPTSYTSPTDFSSNVSGKFTAYMLVNSAADLGKISTNNTTLSGTYSLGKNIDATNFTTSSGTQFTGILDGNGGLLPAGLGYAIENLTLSSSNSMDSMGLFPFIGTSGIVRNLELTNVNIKAGNNIQFIGAVAGENDGTIRNVIVSGTVSGGAFSGIGAGGVAGQNRGSIANVTSNVTVSVSDATSLSQLNMAGGVVASNLGSVSNAQSIGNISGGANSFVGGIAGQNGLTGVGGGIGTITASYSLGNMTATGIDSAVGGIAGTQAPGSTITDSQAFGMVTALAARTSLMDSVDAGGITGNNSGTITGTTKPTLASICVLGAAFTCSSATVTTGAGGTGGGIAGFSQGTIANVLAMGPVTGAAGSSGGTGKTNLGGVAGTNQGMVQFAIAKLGTVGTLGVSGLNVGGLIGDNSGTVNSSIATMNVFAGDNSNAGGFAADISHCNCSNQANGDGQNDNATVTNSTATGSVTVGANSAAGGFVAFVSGSVSGSTASGSVIGGGKSTLGGFAGASGGTIIASTASGVSVTSTDANSAVAGFIGVNGGTVSGSSASGPVTGTSNSYLGGFVAVNLALVQDSSTSSTVTGTGANNVVGGFAGINFGTIDPSSSSGNATSGPNSIVGGFVGANAAFSNFSAGLLPGLFPIGSVSSDSSGTGAASGGTGSTVGSQIGQNFPTSGVPGFPGLFVGCGDTICVILDTGILFDPFPNNNPNNPNNPNSPNLPTLPQQQVISNLTGDLVLASLTSPVDILPPPAPLQPRPGPGAQPFGEPRVFAVPPPGETRFITDEVMLEVDCHAPQAAINAAARDMHLTIMASQCLTVSGKMALRMHIDNGQTVAQVIRAMARYRVIALAQPIYVFLANQDPASDPDLAGRTQEGDAAQYALSKLGVFDAHRLLKGDNVTIAVIDSEIDVHHPDLDGVIAQEYDAVGKAEPPHPHGTGMAGAIAAHHRLMGIAPSSRLFAVHAFSSGQASAESTTYSILKGLDWAVSNGARVINMSFAGPRDPSIERALKTAHDRGIVLVAAAGNAGPKSAPLFPGADPNVIAVTATDIDDKVFSGANRGSYIAVAAPGVDILVPGTDGGYQLTTGTSVACAEVSGVAALLLERNPKLTPEDVRKILTTSAKKLGASTDYGAGLVDLAKAIQEAGDIKPLTPARR